MATMQDVAARAGVSLSTVSYALSGTRPVSARTRSRIEDAMSDLGYQPNAMARGLAARASRVLALIVPTSEMGLGRTVGEFVTSAAETAREHGYHLVLWPFQSAQAVEIRDLLRQGMADGVLLMEVGLDDPRVEVLAEAGLPYTMIGRTRDVTGRPSVDIDFERTTHDAVAHLVGLGHRHIALLNHSQASLEEGYGPTHRARDGFEVAMRGHGLDPVAVCCDESPLAGRAATADLLAREPRLTALITMNEIATFGVVAELQQRGVAIPGEMSILSIVSSPGIGAMSHPPLATMHSPGAALGRLGVEKLLAVLAGSPGTENALLPCVLEPGGSVAPAPTRTSPQNGRALGAP